MTTTTSTCRRSSSDDRPVVVLCSTRADGDFDLTDQPFDELDARRRRFVDRPWTLADERHGIGVVRVTVPGGGDGEIGDILITDLDDTVLGCWVGDCAPVVMIGAGREFAVVHAGWRGLAGGVIDAAFDAFTEPVRRVLLGPTIGPCCYEFGIDDLRLVATGVHATDDDVRSQTASGTAALDMPAAVRAACRHRGAVVEVVAGCTGCSYDGFSYRVRGDRERHVVAAWRDAEASA
jgi:copper oxidase (laccase) domain-containing protein